MLDKNKISSLLDHPAEVFVYDTVTSTNDVAKNLSNDYNGCILVVADGQTNGRGRQGKRFFSPKNTGLYFTMVFPTDAPVFEFTGVTCAAAVATARAIEKLSDIDVKIKWVNDIYIDNRKICGILVQSVSENAVVKKLIVGIGVNVSTLDFPSEISTIAGSLNKDIDRNVLAAEIANNLSELIFRKTDDYIAEYKSKSNVIGQRITYIQNNTEHQATAVNIDRNGGLVVKTETDTITLTSGEISVRFPLK